MLTRVLLQLDSTPLSVTLEHESDTKAALEGLMRDNGFTAESRFYRATLPEFLSPSDEPGVYQISAKDDPSEAIVDVYGQGHWPEGFRSTGAP